MRSSADCSDTSAIISSLSLRLAPKSLAISFLILLGLKLTFNQLHVLVYIGYCSTARQRSSV